MHLLKLSWLARHAFALVMLLMMLSLGFWQLARLEQRRTINRAIAAAIAAPVVPFTGNEADLLSFVGKRVRIRGVFDNAQNMVLRNQTRQQENGVHLLTPLRLMGSNVAIIVDRGWVPAPPPGRFDWSSYAIDGDVEIEGMVHATQTRPNASLTPLDLPLPGETRIAAWLRIDLERMQQQIPYPILRISLEQFADPTAPSAAFPIPQTGETDEGPHLGYALQWFTFAAMLIVIYTILMWQELRRTTRFNPT